MNDLISRQAAIEDIREYKVEPNHCCDESEIEGYNDGLDTAISALATLPSAQKEFEWCHDCKEYDQERHCCPRWSKVIRRTVDEIKAEQRWHTDKPTEDGDYLCYKYGDDDGFGYFYVDTFYTHEGTVEYGTPLAYRGWQDDHDRVLAWMPLPEPYEVEE